MNKEVWEIVGIRKPTGSFQKETSVVSVTISISFQNRHSRTLLQYLHAAECEKMYRDPRGCGGRSPSGRMSRLHSVTSGILRSACSTSPNMDANLEMSALTRIARLTVAMLKNTRQLGCVFQDMEPPKSSSILRKSSDIREPIRCVQFTKAVIRHADIRDQNPSLGMICPGDPR